VHVKRVINVTFYHLSNGYLSTVIYVQRLTLREILTASL